MRRSGREGVLNQRPGRRVLRYRRGGFNRADEYDQRRLVVIDFDLDPLFDGDPGVTGVGVEGFGPAANLQGHLTDRARCDPSGYPPCPADHLFGSSAWPAWLGLPGHAPFTWRKLLSQQDGQSWKQYGLEPRRHSGGRPCGHRMTGQRRTDW